MKLFYDGVRPTVAERNVSYVFFDVGDVAFLDELILEKRIQVWIDTEFLIPQP